MDPSEKHYDGPEPDDALHDPGPRLKGKGPDRRLGDSRYIHGSTRFASWRGWLNVIGILCIIIPLVGFFAACVHGLCSEGEAADHLLPATQLSRTCSRLRIPHPCIRIPLGKCRQ